MISPNTPWSSMGKSSNEDKDCGCDSKKDDKNYGTDSKTDDKKKSDDSKNNKIDSDKD